MGIVAGMHAAVIFIVAGALVIKQDALPEVMTGTVIDEPEPPVEPSPTTPPKMQDQVLHVPLPEPTYERDDPPLPDVIGAKELPQIGETERVGSAEPIPIIEGVRADPRRPLTQPEYPASEIRAGNEGNADIEVYVLPNGRVGDARIVRSTGHARLDQAALEEAKKNWRLLPAKRDGVAIAQWHRLRVVFKLTKN